MTTRWASAYPPQPVKQAPAAAQRAQALPSPYTALVNWAFAIFSSTRLLTYLPTLWAIHVNGDSSQHSLLTWLAWVGSNVSMAAWLYENNGRRMNKAIAVTAGNALMCTAACALILAYR